MRQFFIIIGLCLLSSVMLAQSNQVVIDSILLSGNKRTKDNIILRELDFKQGDLLSIDEVNVRFANNRLRLINTRLFNDAKLNISNWREDTINIEIDLREGWYIYPMPIFELADRNFNVWWVEQNHRFNRINLGLRFYYLNFTGRNDRLKIATQFGYTQKMEAKYQLPFANKKQTLGFSVNGLFSRNREVAYQTNQLSARQDFLRLDKGFGLKRGRAGAGLIFRPKLNITQKWNLDYLHHTINDTIRNLNSNFLGDGRLKQQYFSLEYEFEWDKRDRRYYPHNGFFLEVQAIKNGFGIFNHVNDFSVSATFANYFQTGKWLSFEYGVKGKKNIITKKQPYYLLRQGLGYKEEFVRGYEFYVIDGQDYAYLKTGIRFHVLDVNINASKIVPINAFKLIPLRIYLKLNSDFGVVHDPFAVFDNPVANQFLWGGGPAIDIVLYHSFVLRLEYSINRFKEKGLYLHFNLPF